MDHRRGHHIPCLLLRMILASEQGQDGFFDLDERLVLYGRGGRLRMASASEGEGDFGGIHLLHPAPGHEIDLVLHLGKCEDHAEIFHLHKLVHQHREVTHIFLAADLAQTTSTPLMMCVVADLVRSLRTQICSAVNSRVKHVRDQVALAPCSVEPCCGTVVFRPRRGEGERGPCPRGCPDRGWSPHPE